jgi:hypothetical protein
MTAYGLLWAEAKEIFLFTAVFVLAPEPTYRV